MSAEAKANPMVNPPADADIHEFRDLTEDETKTIEDAFVAATEQS
jgi:hypothetical protein